MASGRRRKVIRHIQEKLSCRARDIVVAAPAPHHAIARGRAGAGLLAHIVVSKYDDHFARASRWKPRPCPAVGSVPIAAALQPLIDAFAGDVMASDSLHADDTPVPVLAAGIGKTKTGRLWTYVRDQRPFAGKRPSADCSSTRLDRKSEHPRDHLRAFRGVIHADGYAGFNELFAGNRITGGLLGASMDRPSSAR